MDFSKTRNYVVITDIANYYDFISHQHLRNILSSIEKTPESVLNMLLHILTQLAWRPDFMPHSGVGLPQINVDAPRALAHAMLFELDRVAEKKSYGDYARFMDDIDVGVDDVKIAKTVLRDIDLTLQSRQLRLNSGKTKILKSDDALIHFCARENMVISLLRRRIRAKIKTKKSLEIEKVRILRIHDIFKNMQFENVDRYTFGNGEKILKRVMTTSRQLGVGLPIEDLFVYIRTRPNMRDASLRMLSMRHDDNKIFERVLSFACSGLIVDQMAHINISQFAVDFRIKNKASTLSAITKYVKIVGGMGPIEFCCSVMVSLKYLNSKDVFENVEKNVDVWRNNHWASRVLAGVAIRLRMTKYFSRFMPIYEQFANREALSSMNFALDMCQKKGFCKNKDIWNKIMAPNPSLSQQISFPKVLLIMAVSKNLNQKAEKAALLAKHPALSSDPFFHRMLA